MDVRDKNQSVKIFVLITFILMILVNALANILPINGQLTAQVSNYYPNLFTPIPLTFSIWGVIYIALTFFVLYYFGFFNDDKTQINIPTFNRIGLIFAISSIINSLWIFAWHYHQILLSVILMILLLICLGLLNSILFKEKLTNKEKRFFKIPSSLYYGWITIALIANITACLVSLGLNGFGLSEEFWVSAIIIVGMMISIVTIITYNDINYGLVIIWSYIGILMRHLSGAYFNMQYPSIIIVTIVCVSFIVIIEIYISFVNHKKTI